MGSVLKAGGYILCWSMLDECNPYLKLRF